ncbi:hypothetical protein Bbelb_311350 [Branchiostoma belcheri]|nr:hypothetical protein Bbelb_311350 [Branchiostoma belcheri]
MMPASLDVGPREAYFTQADGVGHLRITYRCEEGYDHDYDDDLTVVSDAAAENGQTDNIDPDHGEPNCDVEIYPDDMEVWETGSEETNQKQLLATAVVSQSPWQGVTTYPRTTRRTRARCMCQHESGYAQSTANSNQINESNVRTEPASGLANSNDDSFSIRPCTARHHGTVHVADGRDDNIPTANSINTINDVLQPTNDTINDVLQANNDTINDVLQANNDTINDVLQPNNDTINDVLHPANVNDVF